MPAVSYYSPLDRAYYGSVDVPAPKPALEAPILPMNRIGQTVPEIDPSTGAGVLQNVQAAIRRGVSELQIVMSTPSTSAVGGRFKAIGREVREELKESLRMNEVHLRGVELPTAISNLSGYNPQHGVFDDQGRTRDVQEVKDAIKFAADIGAGGGIDVLSWEYDRNFSDAKWNKKVDALGKQQWLFVPPEGAEEKEMVQYVDKQTGRVQGLRKSDVLFLPFNPSTFDPKKKYEEQYAKSNEGEQGNFRWDFNILRDVARRSGMTEIQLLMKLNESQEEIRSQGYAEYYMDEASKRRSAAEEARTRGDTQNAQKLMEAAVHSEALARSNYQQLLQLREQRGRLVPLHDFALSRATDAYAELGIVTMDETRKQGNKIEKPIYVGPELGWPTFYGSHPDEFVELIRNARQKMTERLVQERHMSKSDAETEAKMHIKGTFDTSHFGMFLEHFMPWESDYDKRVKEFNKWYMKEIDKLAEINAKEQILGGVQIVNSMSGAHGHLPPTQGIFPVVEATKKLIQKGNFDGFVISEGHEEERLQQGRIVLDAWRAFDPTILGGSYAAAGSGAWNPRWTDTHQEYFGRPYSPMFIVGDFAPSQDWKLWSEVPLE